jgi:hypothetical protein
MGGVLLKPPVAKTGVTTVGGGMATTCWPNIKRNCYLILNAFSRVNQLYQYALKRREKNVHALVNRAGETTEGRRGRAGAPSCGIASPGGGIAKLEAAAAAAARAGDVRPRAVVRVAAAVANVGLRRAERPAKIKINKIK